MVMLNLGSSRPLSPAHPRPVAADTTTNNSNNDPDGTMVDNAAMMSMSSDMGDVSYRSIAEFEELLMEAGYTQQAGNHSNQGSGSQLFQEASASQRSLTKSPGRPRISSCASGSSVSDGSFMTATQQPTTGQSSQQQSPCASFDSDDSSSHQFHHQSHHHADIEGQLATPAPEHVCRGVHCCACSNSNSEDRGDDNNDNDNFENEYDVDDENDFKPPAHNSNHSNNTHQQTQQQRRPLSPPPNPTSNLRYPGRPVAESLLAATPAADLHYDYHNQNNNGNMHHLIMGGGSHNDHNSSVPVIPLSGIQLLEEKSSKRLPTSTAVSVQSQSDDGMTVSTNHDNDNASVSSAQSLVSVVAELVAYPIKVFAAVMADLNTEMIASHMGPNNNNGITIPSRAEFISATILLQEKDQEEEFENELDGLAPPSTPTTLIDNELGLRLERQLPNNNNNNSNSQNRVLVITEIDPQGHWHASPLQVGDRIISINHTNVSQWTVEEVHQFWKSLLPKTGMSMMNHHTSTSVTLVAHNPTGEGQWVAAMVTKPAPSVRTGLGMRSSRPGRVKISRVGGLFSDSLLNPGDQILSINGLGVHGYNSADTANEILQSPKYVTVLAKSDCRGAFVIATNNHNHNNNASTRSLLLAQENNNQNDANSSSNNNNNTSEDEQGRDNDDNDRTTRQHVVLSDSDPTRCDNCGCYREPCTTLRMLHWAGEVYVVFLMCLGLYFCVENGLSLSMVMAVMVLSVVMMNMVHMTIKTMRRRQLEPYKEDEYNGGSRCSVYQLSCNVILLGAFLFLIILWRNLGYTVITSEFVLAVVVLVLVPMLVFINMPSCCVLPQEFPLEPPEDEDDLEQQSQANERGDDDAGVVGDYFEDESGDEEAQPEAVATIVETP